jgi:hypothetical protein
VAQQLGRGECGSAEKDAEQGEGGEGEASTPAGRGLKKSSAWSMCGVGRDQRRAGVEHAFGQGFARVERVKWRENGVSWRRTSRGKPSEVVLEEEASARRAALVGSRCKDRAIVCEFVGVSALSVSPAKAIEQQFERVQGSTSPKLMKSSVASSSRSLTRDECDRLP